MMRPVLPVALLVALAACDDAPATFENPGLFEPYMFNDQPYNVSFTGTTPITDTDLLAQGFVAGREIAVFRMSGEPFGAADEAEAAAVAAAFCGGGALIFVPGAAGILGQDNGYVFARNCLEHLG